ncbi:MAG: hypothetical protein ACWA5R_13115 [bacterium]
MKLTDDMITTAFQNEPSLWKEDDYDWLDEQFIKDLRSNKLDQVERIQFTNLVANNSAVAARFKAINEKLTPGESRDPVPFYKLFLHILFNGPVRNIAMITLFAAVFVVVIFSQQQNTPITPELVLRSAGALNIYPKNNSVLEQTIDYIDSGLDGNSIHTISIYNSKNELIWKSARQTSPRFYLSPQVKDKMKTGVFHWSIDDNKETYFFTIKKT